MIFNFKTKWLPLMILVILSGVLQGQVGSSCKGADSIVTKYRDDSRRLAVRRVFKIGSGYKDSVRIDTSQSSRYLRALIAVYNATAIPARDTVVRLLNIHTRPDPELRGLHIKAPGTLSWMNKLMNSTTPTGNGQVDQLMSTYKLQPIAYYQSVNYDLAVLKSDSSLNIAALAAAFKGISGVIDSAPETSYDDTKNITDSTGTGFTILDYSFGWGTCANGCDYRAAWRFKVYSDCTVEWIGSTGDTLYTGISESAGSACHVRMYPNPAKNALNFETSGTNENVSIVITDLTGRVMRQLVIKTSGSTDISELASGLYVVSVSAGNEVRVFRVVKVESAGRP